MALLILTRAGLEELLKEGKLPDMPLFINSGIIGREELTQLSGYGTKIFHLPESVDPFDPDAVRKMATFAAEASGSRVWIEAVEKKEDSLPYYSPQLPPKHKGVASPVRFFSQARRAFRSLAKPLSSNKQLLIIPYLGYGNAHRITLRGRVLKDEDFKHQRYEDSGWENLVALYRKLESDQVSNARVVASFRGVVQEALTDQGGYFSFDIKLPVPLDTAGWQTVALELAEPHSPGSPPIQAQALVLIPPATARFGIISDIDDTVIWSNVTNKINMMLMLARSNAYTRKPFKGVAAFYRALQSGLNGNENNPIFYVSSSPWHLFSSLQEFLTKQEIPLGPLMLKELSIMKLLGSGRHVDHKLEKIEAILAMYPELQFILIGDSGEQDPEIYAEVVRRHPKAVKVIYIRNINPDPSRIDAIDRLIEQVRPTGTQLVLAPDSEFAAAHAASEGLIQLPRVGAVRLEKEADGESGKDTKLLEKDLDS